MTKIAVMCPADIAKRRFMPAIKKYNDYEYVGVGMYSEPERFEGKKVSDFEKDLVMSNERNKQRDFLELYGGIAFDSYRAVIEAENVEAVYIPLPPALHYKWAKAALLNGKHVLVEKPFATSLEETRELIDIARERGLAIHENYMFVYHKQIQDIKAIIATGEIGNVRLYNISFGFPMREKNDFRYKRELGGGALLDAGGYTIKYASEILGETAKVEYARLGFIEGFEVDMYGSGALSNDAGDVVQIGFGMDNNYRCDLRVWGSLGELHTGRVLTAPADFTPNYIINKGNEKKEGNLSCDDAFLNSIKVFHSSILNENDRKSIYKTIYHQAEMLDSFIKKVW